MELSDIKLSFAQVAGAVVGLYIVSQLFRDRRLHDIPAVGHTIPILNLITSVQFVFNARGLIQEGYEKYQTAGVFRVATLSGWLMIVTTPKLVEEVRRARDDMLSFDEAAHENMQVDYTLGTDTVTMPYHIDTIRNTLTRNLGTRFEAIWDEIQVAFEEEIHTDREWKELSATEAIQRIVVRVSNRLFVDLPLCRNRQWMQLNIDYTMDIAEGAMLLKITPAPLRPLLSTFLSKIKAQRGLANKLVGPIIAGRLKDFEDHNEKWDERPNDLISWLIEECPAELRTVHSLVNRVLFVNFVAIHTSSITFLNALYRLADNPEWAAPMREEVERVVATDGWTKLALAKMHRVDSFIRETQRVHAINMLSLQRWVMKPFTFSNGVCIPAGYQITGAAEMLQIDSKHHGEHAATFDPWRWSSIREEESEALKHQMVATGSTLLHFGHGKHACPGRSFAANELKGMLAHLVLEYDVRFKEGESMPPSSAFEQNIIPPEAKLETRKRQSRA